MFIASILGPPLKLNPNLPYPRIELLLIPVICYVYALWVLTRRAHLMKFHFLYFYAFLFCCSVLVSMIYGSVYLHHQLIGRDFFEIAKVWVPVLFFAITYEANLAEGSLRRLLTVLAWATAAVCLYGWAQFFYLPGVERLDLYYSMDEAHEMALITDKRIYSTMSGNANVLAQFLTCAIVCYTLAFLSDVGSRIRNISIVLATVAALVLTSSRYGLIDSVLGLLLSLRLTFPGRHRAAKLAGLVFLFALSGWTVVETQRSAPEAAARFQELKHPEDVNSLRQRLDVLWGEAFDYFKSSPIFGHGPAKQIFTDVWTDSEYLDVLKQYGLIGFVCYLSMYGWVLSRLWRGLKATRRLDSSAASRLRVTFLVARLGFIMLVVDLVMNIGMFTFYNFQFGAFFWLMMGLGVRCAETIAQASEQSRQYFPLSGSPAKVAQLSAV